MQDIIQTLAIWSLPVLLGITLHEAAHAYVAYRLGDETAHRAGRVSLNPLRHIDPVGTLLVPLGIYLLSSASGMGMVFGWARAVAIEPTRLRRGERDMLWVAAAGPGANLAMAFMWALLFKIAWSLPLFGYTEAMSEMARAGVKVNLVLMALNLLPLPPLDGGRMLMSVLPLKLAQRVGRLEPFGLTIIVVLMALNQSTGVLGAIISPIVGAARAVLEFVMQIYIP